VTSTRLFSNPFRPGAGHPPPFLAGRTAERSEFERLLGQDVILENLVLTGLRGVGKTVLLDTLKPVAISAGWLWVGTDLSESTSLSEERVAVRLITDLAVATSSIKIGESETRGLGFGAQPTSVARTLDFAIMKQLYDSTPGLAADKLKALLELVWRVLSQVGKRGIVFAYDEAQNMTDHAKRDEYPLSLMLDVFQSIQKKGAPLMLVMVGLPTLFPKLVDARTFAERMFRVVFLQRLGDRDCRDAIVKPIDDAACPVHLSESSIATIVEMSAGYPYFVQFICREVFDAFAQGQESVPVDEITRKLDSDFFAGRWARATDRQRDLLAVIATLDHTSEEFTVQELVERSKELLRKPFSASHINQMLAVLANNGLIYKNRYGKYSFAVPLMDRFIGRQAPLGS
jgi:hypothetical protein